MIETVTEGLPEMLRRYCSRCIFFHGGVSREMMLTMLTTKWVSFPFSSKSSNIMGLFGTRSGLGIGTLSDKIEKQTDIRETKTSVSLVITIDR